MSHGLDREDVPLVAGAVAGLAAWVLGYLCTYLVAGGRIRDSGLGRLLEFLGEGGTIYKLVGWVFYNSHFVETVLTGAPVTVAGNAIGGDGGFTPLLFAVPPALLLAAGLAIARFQGSETSRDGVLAGVAVVPTYLLLSVLGVFLFTVSAGPATGRPDPLLAVLVAGIVYPAAFGGLGGIVASMTASEVAS